MLEQPQPGLVRIADQSSCFLMDGSAGDEGAYGT